jgi:hypothetical protein
VQIIQILNLTENNNLEGTREAKQIIFLFQVKTEDWAFMLANLVCHPLSIFVMESILSFVILLKIKSTFFFFFVPCLNLLHIVLSARKV